MPLPPMLAFFERFPDVAERETRVITLPRPMDGLPVGSYAFVELYCTDPECDCRRVFLQVESEHPLGPVLATIAYGWASVAHYRKWLGGDLEDARDLAGASLDPFNLQTRFAPPLLHLFETVLLPDQNYVDRLKRHYAMFKPGLGLVPSRKTKKANPPPPEDPHPNRP